MKKTLYWFVVVLVLVSMVIAGCGGGTGSGDTDNTDSSNTGGDTDDTETPLKIGLVIPGSINDGGWSQAAYEGLLAIEEEYGAEISYMEASSASDVIEGFRDYGARGYDVVFGHSYDYQDAAARVSPDFPDTVYITSGGTTVMDNVSPIYFEFEQATYLAGVVAAKMSQTGRVAAIGGTEIPAISKTLNSFEQGAKDTNPDIQVIKHYLGTQEDLGVANETTQAMISEGYDVFWVSANQAGQGALQAVEEHSGDVYIFGSYGKWSEDSPDVVIADLYLDQGKSFITAVEKVLGGFEPGEITVGIKEDVVHFDWNMTVDDEIVQAYEDALEKIQNNQIVIDIGAY